MTLYYPNHVPTEKQLQEDKARMNKGLTPAQIAAKEAAAEKLNQGYLDMIAREEKEKLGQR